MKEAINRMANCTDDVAPSDAYGIVSTVKNLVVLLALYVAVPRVTDGSIWLDWALMPVVGLFNHRLTMVMHDCGHATLFSSRRVNVDLEKLLGFLTGVDFSGSGSVSGNTASALVLPVIPRGSTIWGCQE